MKLLDQRDPPAGLVDRIWRGEALGVVLRGWVDPSHLAELVDAGPGLPRRDLTPGAHVHGSILAPTVERPDGPDLDDYLQAAARCREEGLPPPPVLARIDRALAAMASRPVEGMVSPDGRAYAAATLRVFTVGAGAPLHNDRYRPLPCHAAVDATVDRTTQLSWYVGVAVPPAGGELTVAGAATVTVGPGDLIVFDGARFDHRVERCRGGERRTLGGFAGLSRDGRCLYRWS